MEWGGVWEFLWFGFYFFGFGFLRNFGFCGVYLRIIVLGDF